MTIHEPHPAPLMQRMGLMQEIKIICDFCEKDTETAYTFTIKDGKDIDVCPRCMAILEDEVRKRLREGEE